MQVLIIIDGFDLTAYAASGFTATQDTPGPGLARQMRIAARDGFTRRDGKGLYRTPLAEDGVYRAAWSHRSDCLTLGKRLGDVSADVIRKEGERLVAKGEQTHKRFRHSAPGVAGNQEHENLVNASAQARKYETRGFGRKLIEVADGMDAAEPSALDSIDAAIAELTEARRSVEDDLHLLALDRVESAIDLSLSASRALKAELQS